MRRLAANARGDAAGCDGCRARPDAGRRRLLLALLALGSLRLAPARAVARDADLPDRVAGIALPRTRLSLAAAALSRRACPPFLFNHCMRTFVFGALHARHMGLDYAAEPAFAAAALHDLGLLPAYETPGHPFEVDSADAAERLARRHGASAEEARLIWNATVMHDMRWAVAAHQGPVAMLVAAGAGTDVVGPDPGMIPAEAMREVLAAFPRLGFKARFKQLLTAHCQRKPTAQTGTWLDGYCRAAVPGATFPSTAAAIDAAPFTE